jgi:DNA/RNA endonuclease YhcR with UshA esterase domain
VRVLSPHMFPLALAALIALPARGVAQNRVVPDSLAAQYVGQSVTVEGTVVAVTVSRRSNTTFLNFGQPYPKQVFTAVIFRSAASRFPDPQQWEGRRVRVTGTVRLYQGKPEIVLDRGSQVVLAT